MKPFFSLFNSSAFTMYFKHHYNNSSNSNFSRKWYKAYELYPTTLPLKTNTTFNHTCACLLSHIVFVVKPRMNSFSVNTFLSQCMTQCPIYTHTTTVPINTHISFTQFDYYFSLFSVLKFNFIYIGQYQNFPLGDLYQVISLFVSHTSNHIWGRIECNARRQF